MCVCVPGTEKNFCQTQMANSFVGTRVVEIGKTGGFGACPEYSMAVNYAVAVRPALGRYLCL